MIMRIDMFSGLMKAKSHPAVTPSAGREYCTGYRCNLMAMGVIVAIEFVVYYVIDAGNRHLLSRFELFILARHFALFA
jgi:hypothetical protein